MTTVEQAKYLLSRSDVEAALLLLTIMPEEGTEYQSITTYIRKYWPSWFGEYNRVYQEAGKIEAKNVAAFVHIPREARYQWLLGYLKAHPELQRFYNFGASRCLYDIHLHNEIGGYWCCEDIDDVSIREARDYINIVAKEPGNFQLGLASYPKTGQRNFDAAICMEVLEHVIDPVAILNGLEKNVRDGGKMIISVPYGPIEYLMWQNSPERNREHIREFSINELNQLFEYKADIEYHQLSYGRNEELGMEIGCNIVCYTVTEDGRGFDGYNIDLEGKLAEAKKVALPGF